MQKRLSTAAWMQHENTYNPVLTAGNSEKLTEILASLLPMALAMSPEEQTQFETERADGLARYQEARYGKLPTGTYRLLEQGDIMGWRFELEIDGTEVLLQEPGKGITSAYAVHANKKRADELARAEIALRHGQAAADTAKFRLVWGGSL